MMRIRLSVPLNLFLNSSRPELLALPALTFQHKECEVQVTLKGGAPLKLDHGSEPHFRIIHECQIEVRQGGDAAHRLLALIQLKNFAELVTLSMPIVNKTLAAIRNFGWVTTAREYKPEQEPEILLRAWGMKARIHGEWREVAPKPPATPFDLFYGLSDLDQNVERGSLSESHWPDIEQALVEGLKPNPEQEFLTNSLQHLERDKNPRLALIEATVCLEIVLSECVRLYLEVKRHFNKEKINRVLSNVGLTTKVGLLTDPLLSYDDRNRHQMDRVLKGIGWRNKIIHDNGHIPSSVPAEDVREAIYEMLNLSLSLSRRRDELRAEPAMKRIGEAVAESYHCPNPEIKVLKHHEVSATFTFQSKTPTYLRALGSALPSEDKIPDRAGLQQIVDGLSSKLKERDQYFESGKHLSAKFQRGIIDPFVFATVEKGQWKYMPEPD
jgi:hypothetical protein